MPVHAARLPCDADHFKSKADASMNKTLLDFLLTVLRDAKFYSVLQLSRSASHKTPGRLGYGVKFEGQDAFLDGYMTVRAPYGFTFEEECLQFVEVSESATFGPKVRFPEDFAVWPSDVAISTCRGVDRMASLWLQFATGARLIANELYIFRIGIKSNPMVTPEVNRWVVQLGSEASEPIEGMTLWAFTQTGVTPITTARDRTLAGEVRTQNPLKFRIRPFNTIHMNGEIRAVAPAGFTFVHEPSKACTSELEELPYTNLGVFYPGFVWPEDDLVCLVDADDSTKVTVRYRNPRPVTAGLDYVVVLSVYNPNEIVSFAPTVWQLLQLLASTGCACPLSLFVLVSRAVMDSDDAGSATVSVAVRMRPISQKETEINEGGEVSVEVVTKEGKVILKRADHPPKPFEFDHAFGSESTQPQVFRYNATIFAYGQTGSGKTHTMMSDRNNKEDRGLIPRIADTLFERIYRLSSDSRKFLVCCSFLEIYNEIVYDLLVPRGRATPHAGLEIREGKGMGVYVKDLQEIVVDTAEKLNRLIDQGFEHRATAATQMNATSSRSH
eukprot:s3349_g3.t1